MQELLEELSNVYDVSVSAVQKSGGNSSVDSYINATLWTIVFNDPVGDVPGLEVCTMIWQAASQFAQFVFTRFKSPTGWRYVL